MSDVEIITKRVGSRLWLTASWDGTSISAEWEGPKTLREMATLIEHDAEITAKVRAISGGKTGFYPVSVSITPRPE